MSETQEESVEAQAVSVVTPLTMPCTALQLRNWLQGIDALRPGSNSAAVTATASSITVA